MIVAMACLMLPKVAMGENGSCALQIVVSRKTIIYVQCRAGKGGGEMRLATSSEGLTTASPIRTSVSGGTKNAFDQFPEVTLPVPAEDLPDQVRQVNLSLRWIRGDQPKLVGGLRILHGPREGGGESCEYLQRIYNLLPITPNPGYVPEIRMADMTKLRLDVAVNATIGSGQIGVAVKLMGGDVAIHDVKRKGVSIPVLVRILDSQKKEVARRSETLNEYGFG